MIEDDELPPRQILTICCCRNEYFINAGCKLHGIGMLSSARMAGPLGARPREVLPGGRGV